MGLATPLRIIGCLWELGHRAPFHWQQDSSSVVKFSSSILWEAVTRKTKELISSAQQGRPDFDLTQLDHQENHTRAPALEMTIV